MLAVGLEYFLPKEVGKLVILVEEWDYSSPDIFMHRMEPLPTHTCTEEELGFETIHSSKPHLFQKAK